MKIKICKNYQLFNTIYESDRTSYWNHANITFMSDYNVEFFEEEVNKEQLIDYINKGYAIKINM